ncbi:hypothetical protein ACNKHR_17435 [Shigella flexneri]
MALTRAYTTLRDDFIIWHYRNCRATCRRIASPQSVNWCGKLAESGWRRMKYGIIAPNFESLRSRYNESKRCQSLNVQE